MFRSWTIPKMATICRIPAFLLWFADNHLHETHSGEELIYDAIDLEGSYSVFAGDYPHSDLQRSG